MEKHIVEPSIIIKDIKDILAVFKKYDVPIFLAYGATLGAVRDKDFIPWDDDVDFVITKPIDYQTRKAIGWTLFDLGFKPQPIAFNVFGRMETSELGYNGDAHSGIIVCERGFKFSFFFFGETDCPKHGKEFVCFPKVGCQALICSPIKFYEKPEHLKLHGVDFMVPGPVKDYLTHTYGDWKTPVKGKHAPQAKEEHGQ